MKNINVIIVHGAYGYPEENWFGWLKEELHHQGIACHVPQLPTPNGQHLQTWIESFSQSVKYLITSHTVLIGHSLGAVFLLRWLEQQNGSIASVILAGAFLGSVNIPEFDIINASFFQTPFNWDLIKTRCNEFVCFYGTGDIYVVRNQFNQIADSLNAKKIIVSQAGHFNTASGYVKFPHILRYIKQIKPGVLG